MPEPLGTRLAGYRDLFASSLPGLFVGRTGVDSNASTERLGRSPLDEGCELLQRRHQFSASMQCE